MDIGITKELAKSLNSTKNEYFMLSICPKSCDEERKTLPFSIYPSYCSYYAFFSKYFWLI